MAQDPTNLIWIDLEMTGLNPAHDQIIEMATLVTTSQLELVAEGPVFAIHQPESVLNGMDEWNTRQHGQSGLVARVKQSRITVAQAQQETLRFLREYVPERASPMCGNSICQDRRFLARVMPDLEAYFHYRNLDVSSLKELCNRWAPTLAAKFTKGSAHLALDDIRESIRELQFYREHFIKIPMA
jgi:oligoribonuclease